LAPQLHRPRCRSQGSIRNLLREPEEKGRDHVLSPDLQLVAARRNSIQKKGDGVRVREERLNSNADETVKKQMLNRAMFFVRGFKFN
jgi:hypothetical protein